MSNTKPKLVRAVPKVLEADVKRKIETKRQIAVAKKRAKVAKDNGSMTASALRDAVSLFEHLHVQPQKGGVLQATALYTLRSHAIHQRCMYSLVCGFMRG